MHSSKSVSEAQSSNVASITQRESLEYSKQMIESIKGIAAAQGWVMLVQLLDLAAHEAETMLRNLS